MLAVVVYALSTQGVIWSPSKIIHRLGKEIDNEDSVYYWAYKVCLCESVHICIMCACVCVCVCVVYWWWLLD